MAHLRRCMHIAGSLGAMRIDKQADQTNVGIAEDTLFRWIAIHIGEPHARLVLGLRQVNVGVSVRRVLATFLLALSGRENADANPANVGGHLEDDLDEVATNKPACREPFPVGVIGDQIKIDWHESNKLEERRSEAVPQPLGLHAVPSLPATTPSVTCPEHPMHHCAHELPEVSDKHNEPVDG
eukprot:scaffold115537_cov32-Tisochrysis_lutea.AAC.1